MIDLQAQLRRFRPASPPRDLRRRVVGADPIPRPWLAWVPVAAALLVAVALSLLAANLHAAVARQELEASGRPVRMNRLIETLGGDGFARAEAGRIVALDEEP